MSKRFCSSLTCDLPSFTVFSLGHVHTGTARGAPGAREKYRELRAIFWDSKLGTFQQGVSKQG